LGELAGELNGHGLSTRPAVFILPNQRKVIVCPNGFANADETFELDIPVGVEDEVSEQTVVELLERFWIACVRTPRRYKKLWDVPSKYVPVSDTEKQIQYQLAPVAKMRFYHGFHVEMELDTDEGRVDILVQAVPGGPARGSCVLELKVLRSKYPSKSGNPRACPPKENDEAVVKGIGQAEGYRNTRQLELAFLVCYDFRQDAKQEYLEKFRPVADPRDVKILWYPAYPDVETARRNRPDSAYEDALERGLVDG
jgi:hypothetical protein